ncbi:hypothetical protein LWI29_026235 [Acer saccharum]|uniref:HMA domain-containing protein n=1 Tax=Acer saccharum TaxID=4024 RepID=A0AA39SEY6_ACESA|nr:hypothetical protein LWI29_026235 [Acer saccharum]
MESTLSISTRTSTLTILTLSKALNLHFSKRFQSTTHQCLHFRARRLTSISSSSSSSSSLSRSLCALLPRHTRRRVQCLSNSAASFGTGGGSTGGDFGGNDGGGGGRGGPDGGDSKSKLAGGGVEGVSAWSPDVIILDVGGMTCGGCAASVKRILENQPQVSSASVNLTTETAIVWPVSEAKVTPNWQQLLIFEWQVRNQLKEIFHRNNAKNYFKEKKYFFVVSRGSSLWWINMRAVSVAEIPFVLENLFMHCRNSGTDNFFRVFERKMDEKRNHLKESGRDLAVSWALCAVCLVGHLSHMLGAKASWIQAFHSTGFHLSLSLFTLLGPGRQLILDGVKSLFRGAPNMNTLVGLGALSSFTVSSLATFLPKLGWKAFFEEPVMLIAFVLLGRNLEQRAKIKATSDMSGLLNILPSKARLLVDNNDAKESESIVEVPCSSLCVGDHIVVLPGDRLPADGIVRAGKSIIDESSFTGEPLPVTKIPGSQVVGGSINLNGTLTVEVRRPGGETAVGDIVRLVEEAQSREAPVQRLADKVSGQFTYGVMALSAATFLFWNFFGAHVLPAAFHHGSPVSLALQLSCSVLVIACPCALGLATPTAVLVGTSLGATRGLLLRGGNVLEKFSMVNTIVFDKTGTLTIGRPVVTEVLTLGSLKSPDLRQNSTQSYSDTEVLRLAAGVESNTVHPIGKAIVEAAQAANCQNVKVVDGTFLEEPGSGTVAIIGNRKVSVGTIDWIRRHGVDENPFQEVDREELKNQSAVYVGVDNTLAGIIYVADQIREDATHVVDYLSRQGIDVYMLSGDRKETAEHVASVVGISKKKVLSEVKPDEKKRFINELQKDQNIVAMVGDGINDAAALASAHIGVAMGGGVGAANEASSVVLMGNKLSQLLDALELSRLTMKTVKQNLWWAFAYNIVGIPIAAGLLLPVTGTMLTPSIAGALMGLSSIGVMANSLLLRFKVSSKQGKTLGASPHDKSNKNSDQFMNFKEKMKHPFSDGRWREG